MKRLFSVFISLVLLLTVFCLPVLAAGPSRYIDDQADLLTDDELDILETKAREASRETACGIYAVILEDYRDLESYDLIEDALEDYYDEMNYGMGPERSAAILMLSMKERDFSFLCFGDAYLTLTEYDLDQITSCFLGDFANDSWYNGFEDYIDETKDALIKGKDGEHVVIADSSSSLSSGSESRAPSRTSGKERLAGTAVSLVIAFIVAVAVRCYYINQMKSVALGRTAENFVSKEGLDLQVKTDLYSHSETVRIYDPPAQSNSSGRSSNSFRSSGGRSGGVRSSGSSGRSSGRSGKF